MGFVAALNVVAALVVLQSRRRGRFLAVLSIITVAHLNIFALLLQMGRIWKDLGRQDEVVEVEVGQAEDHNGADDVADGYWKQIPP